MNQNFLFLLKNFYCTVATLTDHSFMYCSIQMSNTRQGQLRDCSIEGQTLDNTVHTRP